MDSDSDWEIEPFAGIQVYRGQRGHLCLRQQEFDGPEHIIIMPPYLVPTLLRLIREAMRSDAPPKPKGTAPDRGSSE
jgi:hypothetical protein